MSLLVTSLVNGRPTDETAFLPTQNNACCEWRHKYRFHSFLREETVCIVAYTVCRR